MRITYLLASFGFTGGSMVLYKFMDKLCERGYDVIAITPTERISWGPGFSTQLIRERLEITSPQKRLIKFGTPYIKKIPHLEEIARRTLGKSPSVNKPIEQLEWLTSNLIKQWTPSDFTVATLSTTAYAAYSLMDKTIPIYHMQGYEELFFDDDNMRKIARLTYFLPLVLAANSEWLKTQVKKRMGRDSYLLNPGIDLDIFHPNYRFEEKYNNPMPIRIVSYYSPLKLKAWNEAVNAMQAVFTKLGRKVEWVVFGGEPPVRPQLPVKFVGRVFGHALAELYSSAHIVFMNSWYESFPLPPIESMACGSAVVTTRIGTEDYAFHKKNSIVIPPRNPTILADEILGLIGDMAFSREIAEAGVETSKQFTWDHATDRLELIFENSKKNAPGSDFYDVEDLLVGNIAEKKHYEPW